MAAVMIASGSPPAKNHQTFDVVAELSNISGPVMRLQDRERVVADAALGQAGRLRNLLLEIFDQFRDILAPLGERRHPNRNDGKPVKQVLAELAGRDLLFEIARGRGDDADIDRDLGAAIDALEGLFHENAQNLALRLARHVGDFVDEQAPGMRLLQRADLGLLAAIRLLDAEQLGLHALRRDRGGVDDDERAGRSVRENVNGARREFLAGPGRADDQDAAVGRRDFLDRLAQMIERDRMTDQAGRQRRELLELLHFAPQSQIFEGALGDQDEAVGLERLLDEVVGPLLDGGHRGFDVAVTGNHHDRKLGVLALDRRQ